MMKKRILILLVSAVLLPAGSIVGSEHSANSDYDLDSLIERQRAMLARNTKNKGFGPQSPRDIDSKDGKNLRIFASSPDYTKMNLCNIHLHKNAEHKGGEFTTFAGHGDGHGYKSGYKYDGQFTSAELKPVNSKICPSAHGSLYPGDTIEVHYVHSTAKVNPGPTLQSCMNGTILNPQLRVEAQVFVLVNDIKAKNFLDLTKHAFQNNLHQAVNIPTDTGTPVQYVGSTTGPSFNEKGSPLQVSWGVRPKVAKVNIKTVGEWCEGNTFGEEHAHGVRNLVVAPELLSPIR